MEKHSFLKNYFFLAFCIFLTSITFSQDLEKEAHQKIKTLENLIKQADKKNIDVLKEKTTIRSSEIFLKYANWDEKNFDENEKYFKRVPSYKEDASKLAKELPNFERNEVLLMLDNSIAELTSLIAGKTVRKPSPEIDWTKIKVEQDHLSFNNRPVFLADYSWKPKTKELTQYHGNLDGFFITPTYVISEDGTINKKISESLKEKPDGSLGFIFMNHKNVPKWSTDKFGANFSMREDTYTAYDIDNPGARELQSKLIQGVAPDMANKQFSKLGYMLCNEPHFFTYTDATKNKLPWASGGVSHFSIEKFKVWLQNKHQNITILNEVWNTNFNSFSDVKIDIPIDISLQGKPIWYDWMSFNMDRVTDWYSFLKSEVLKYDSNAKVHLKIMPSLWTDNKRSHGIDLEALTDLSGIIGNDSGADHKYTWGKPHEWQKKYSFEWRELCMGFDFMKSVSPNKINFNSENHYLSTVRSRDLYLKPAFVRASFWLAHTFGMDASQIWYWPRNADASITERAGKDFAGTNNQQPRVTNEVAITMIDLNSYGEEILKFQRQRKSIRLFYSKTTAINKDDHMDELFKLYEELNFEGTPLGFVTKDIINKQDNRNWDIVLIYNTPFVTNDEVKALQNYLNSGGIIIIDDKSLLKNEYGNSIPNLDAGSGKIIKLNAVKEIKNKAIAILKDKNLDPEVAVLETNSLDKKGCIWRVVKNEAGTNVLSVVNVGNVGKFDATLKGSENIICKDIIKGINVSTTPVLKPNEVYFVEVISKK
jgi:beta-galactosidase